jgi:hypothetical protein
MAKFSKACYRRILRPCHQIGAEQHRDCRSRVAGTCDGALLRGAAESLCLLPGARDSLGCGLFPPEEVRYNW